MFDVIFIILNYKTYEETIKATNSLLSDDCMLKIMVLIVDNHSPNNSFEELIKFYHGVERVKIVQTESNGGYAKGNNWGLEFAAKYDPKFVCVMNNDVYFKMQQIEGLMKIYQSLPNNTAIISPIQKMPDGSMLDCSLIAQIPSFVDDLKKHLRMSVNKKVYEPNTPYPNLMQVEMIPGAFLFIKYNIFKQLGFFDNRTFLFGEERMLGQKIKNAGLVNYVVLNDYYLHNHSKTIDSEKNAQAKRKLKFDGQLLYTKTYRKNPIIKCFILRLVFSFREIIIKLKTITSKN